ncbi:MAG: acyltransferase family protein [Bacteroidota bacterium]
MTRSYALDVFRGATVCLMILVNNPGSWSHIYDPLEHAPWHGLTPTDLVFPFFLFAVGNAMSFVIPRLQQEGDAAFWKKVVKRSLIIFGVGLFLNWWPFVVEVSRVVEGTTELQKVTTFKSFTWVDVAKNEAGAFVETIKGVRVMGVLQRIAICYFLASIIVYYGGPRKAFLSAAILLLGYWAVCLIGNPADPYSLKGWFGTELDLRILGVSHIYKGEGVPFDPEGLLSVPAAIAQVVFGYLVGDYVRKGLAQPDGMYRMLSGLFTIGVGMLVAGYCWDLVFPINKKIWTSSYTIYTTGLAIMALSTMIYVIDGKSRRGGLLSFFDVFGKNALFVFALSAFLPKGLALIKLEKGVNPWNWLYKKVLVHVPGAPENGSLLYALCVITFMWAICWWMDKKKIYVKV